MQVCFLASCSCFLNPDEQTLRSGVPAGMEGVPRSKPPLGPCGTGAVQRLHASSGMLPRDHDHCGARAQARAAARSAAMDDRGAAAADARRHYVYDDARGTAADASSDPEETAE